MAFATFSGLFSLLCLSYLQASKQQDVYEDLWNKSMDVANKTLHVDFLQQMKSNQLQAEHFVSFTLQDINYLLNVANMLKYMSTNVNEPEDMSKFFTGRYESYMKFTESMYNQYSFTDVPLIKPTSAMEHYLSTYRSVMKEDPIYFAVALLPCSRLWVWLAQNLDIPKNNVYYTWKNENMHGHPEKHYKALLNKYLNTSEKIQNATNLFRTQMWNEYDFFNTS